MQKVCQLVVLGNSDFIVVRGEQVLFRTDKLREVEDFLDQRENYRNSRIGLCNRYRASKRETRLQ